MNSKTSNIIATDIPRYNDKDPPIAPVNAVIYKNKSRYVALKFRITLRANENMYIIDYL